MKNLVSIALALLLVGMTLVSADARAQGACIAFSQHPSMTFGSVCQPGEICTDACDTCRIIYVHNLCDCCVGSMTVSGVGDKDTCFSVCGEVVIPTRPTWINSNPTCDPDSRTLIAASQAHELCQGMAMAMKVCAPTFPFTIEVSWTCNGQSHSQDWTIY